MRFHRLTLGVPWTDQKTNHKASGLRCGHVELIGVARRYQGITGVGTIQTPQDQHREPWGLWATEVLFPQQQSFSDLANVYLWGSYGPRELQERHRSWHWLSQALVIVDFHNHH